MITTTILKYYENWWNSWWTVRIIICGFHNEVPYFGGCPVWNRGSGLLDSYIGHCMIASALDLYGVGSKRIMFWKHGMLHLSCQWGPKESELYLGQASLEFQTSTSLSFSTKQVPHKAGSVQNCKILLVGALALGSCSLGWKLWHKKLLEPLRWKQQGGR